jgi:hypothetical protein
MKRKDGATVGIWLDLETKADLERLAGKIGVTPSHLGKNLVVMGLQEVRTMEKLGILQAAVMFQELRERIHDRVENETERLGGMLQPT